MIRAILVLLCFPLIAHAEIYKWVDENGRVQYGERPPPNVKPVPMRPESMPGLLSDAELAEGRCDQFASLGQIVIADGMLESFL